MKTKTLVGILAASVIGATALPRIGEIKQDCETYQGYKIDSDGDVTYIFDELPRNMRKGLRPNYGFISNPDLTDSLKLGTNYCFTFKDPIFPGARNRILGVSPSRK